MAANILVATVTQHIKKKQYLTQIPSWELAYHIPSKGSWENEFPFPLVGYVSSLEGSPASNTPRRHQGKVPLSTSKKSAGLSLVMKSGHQSLEKNRSIAMTYLTPRSIQCIFSASLVMNDGSSIRSFLSYC